MRVFALSLLGLVFGAATAEAQHHISVAPLPAPVSPSPGKAKVVSLLAARTAAIRTEAQECASLGSGPTEFTSTANITFDSPTLFSIEVLGNSACPGAAHPNSWQYGLTYDMTRGRPYSPLMLYAIGTREKGGQARLAPQVLKLVRAALLLRAGPECRTVVDEQLPETGMSFGLSLTGLNIYFDAAHAVQACFHPVSLPYWQIRGFLNHQEASRLHWRL